MTFLAPDAAIDCDPHTLAMIERQAKAWTVGDFSAAVGDWHPQGVRPHLEIAFRSMRAGAGVETFFRDYGDLRVTITNVFARPTAGVSRWSGFGR